MIGWIDGSAGASGDMLLGALVDAGVPLGALQATIDQLDLEIELQVTTVDRCGLRAIKVDVVTADRQHARHLADVRELVTRLEPDVGEVVETVFVQLAAAEASVHGIPADDVHFHEIGALDCIADVVGVAAGVRHLGLTSLHCSALALGSGTTETAHGRLPVPPPAVVALVAGHVPVSSGTHAFEMTTPTGAALLTTLVDHWGALPSLIIERTGTGAGARDPSGAPNVLRLVVGRPAQEPGESAPGVRAVHLEANVDDIDPRIVPAAIDALLAVGASDAWVSPIVMKKGRAAFAVNALCPAEAVDAVRATLFRETTTIGVREGVVTKRALDRSEHTVLVGEVPVRIKLALLDGEIVNRSAEWRDVAAAATALGRPPKDVLAEANGLAWQPERNDA